MNLHTISVELTANGLKVAKTSHTAAFNGSRKYTYENGRVIYEDGLLKANQKTNLNKLPRDGFALIHYEVVCKDNQESEAERIAITAIGERLLAIQSQLNFLYEGLLKSRM